MVQYTSELEINRSIRDVYNFLLDLNNVGTIMSNEIVDWNVVGNTCSFSIGFAKIKSYYTEMKFSSQIEDQLVELESFGRSEIFFHLRFDLSLIDEKTLIMITFETPETSFVSEICPSKKFLETIVKNLPQGLLRNL